MRLFLLLFLSFSSLSFYFAFNYLGWDTSIHPSIHPSSSRRERAIQNICAENFLWSEIIQPLFLRQRENLFVCWVSNFTCLFLKKFSVTFFLFQYVPSQSPLPFLHLWCVNMNQESLCSRVQRDISTDKNLSKQTSKRESASPFSKRF